MSDRTLRDDLYTNAQTRPFRNIAAVDPRVPSLEPCTAEFMTLAEGSARRRMAHVKKFVTRWVRRGRTNGQVGVCPNIVAVDKGVQEGNLKAWQGELGLDRGTATHKLVLSGPNELVHLRKLTTCLLPSSRSSGLRIQAEGRGHLGTEGRMY